MLRDVLWDSDLEVMVQDHLDDVQDVRDVLLSVLRPATHHEFNNNVSTRRIMFYTVVDIRYDIKRQFSPQTNLPFAVEKPVEQQAPRSWRLASLSYRKEREKKRQRKKLKSKTNTAQKNRSK